MNVTTTFIIVLCSIIGLLFCAVCHQVIFILLYLFCEGMYYLLCIFCRYNPIILLFKLLHYIFYNIIMYCKYNKERNYMMYLRNYLNKNIPRIRKKSYSNRCIVIDDNNTLIDDIELGFNNRITAIDDSVTLTI